MLSDSNANKFGSTMASAVCENPFLTPSAFVPPTAGLFEDSADAQDGYRYVMTKNGPSVDASECEVAEAASVEVMILWGETVLHVQHLTPPRSFYVGEEARKGLSCDYLVPEEKLGCGRAPIVIGQGADTRAVLLPGAKAVISIPGKAKASLPEAIAMGVASPCPEVNGAYQVPLSAGVVVRSELGELTFQVGAGAAGRSLGSGLLDRDWTTSLYMGLSMAVHGAILAAVAMFMPPLGLNDGESATKDQLFLMQQYLSASAERETDTKDTAQPLDTGKDTREGGTGEASKGEQGAMGNPNSRAANHTYGIKGSKDKVDLHMANNAAVREASEFGLIGVLNSAGGGDPNAPSAPWGQDDSRGSDMTSARGNMWGQDIGESFGGGGLGLSGIGEGGGGRGVGIGLGTVGTIGRGAGTGTGQGFGKGGYGLSGRGHQTKVPQVRIGATTSSGALPPEVIQRIVRQNFGRFRMCYENGLRNNPDLQGRVAVRFIIGRDGAVGSVANSGSDLPDPSVTQCVVRSFYGLSFPEPQGGIVTVVYPIMFTPGG